MKKTIMSLLILCCMSAAAFAQDKLQNPNSKWKKIESRVSALYYQNSSGSHTKKSVKMPYVVALLSWSDSLGVYNDTLEKFTITRKTDGITPDQLTLFFYDSARPYEKIVVDSFVKIPGAGESNGFEFMDDWIPVHATFNTMTSTGWLAEERITITTTSRGQEQALYERWTGSAWVNESLEQELYDSLDIHTGYLVKEWDNGEWVNSYGYRVVFTYDGQNNVIQAEYFTIEENGTAWEPDNYREVYTLDINGEISSAVVYYESDPNGDRDSIGGMEWQNFQKGESGPLAIGGWEYTTFSDYEWDSTLNAWAPLGKYSKSYNTNGQETEEIRQSWDTVLTSWQNESRYTTEYDSRGEEKQTIYYIWLSAAWKLEGGTRYTTTYDADGDILEQMEEYYMDSTWEKGLKMTYRYTDPSGFAESKALPQVKFYPNPAFRNLTVELPGVSETYLLKIMDLNGRLISARQVNGQRASIDITNLRPGAYILSLESDKTIMTGRFIRR